MSKERLFQQLIAQMAKDGNISPSEYSILLEKGKEIGIDKESIDLLIQMELLENSPPSEEFQTSTNTSESSSNEIHVFTAAITRGGAILTPDKIEISYNTVTYKKRNKYLINVDSISIPIAKISSVELDTSLLGTNIIINSYGNAQITARKFTKSDAKKIKKLIEERQ